MPGLNPGGGVPPGGGGGLKPGGGGLKFCGGIPGGGRKPGGGYRIRIVMQILYK